MSKFVRNNIGTFENGKAYYEFTREEEDIIEGTEVVLIKEVRYHVTCTCALVHCTCALVQHSSTGGCYHSYKK